MVRQQLVDAQEEVKRLVDANRALLLERTLNNNAANTDSVDANMYEHFLQGKYKRAREQAEVLQVLEEKFRSESESFCLHINGITGNLQTSQEKLRRANLHLQNKYTRQAKIADLMSECNTYGKHKWSQI
jgi:hypothetical protein